MSPIIVMLFKWYLFLALLAAFASITIPFTDLLPGLALSWIALIFFFIGANVKTQYPRTYPANAKQFKIPLLAVTAMGVACSLFATKFYTGQQISSVISALSSGASLYNEYQKYFAQEGIAQFSLNKVPAIVAMYLLKICVLYSFIRVTLLEDKIRAAHIFFLITTVASQMFFSIARGTSFELFEIILLLWFCLSLRAHLKKEKGRILTTSKLIFAMSAIAALSLYSYNISARYSFGEVAACATTELCFKADTLLNQASPSLAQLSYKLSGYFTFGIYYVSHVIKYYWLNDFNNFISLLSPIAMFNETAMKPNFLCDKTLDCGAAWSPDLVSYLVNLGILLTLVFVMFIGYLSKRLLSKIKLNKSILEIGALFYIFLSIISLPVGNFITASSSNILVIVTIIGAISYRAAFKSLRLITK